MIIDQNNTFALAQAVTATAASTNIIDLTVGGDALVDAELYLVIRAGVAATASGAATVNFQLQTAIDAAFTVPVTLFDSGAIAKAAITANTNLVLAKIPIGLLEFVRVNFVVSTGPLTAGTFDAFLTSSVDVKYK